MSCRPIAAISSAGEANSSARRCSTLSPMQLRERERISFSHDSSIPLLKFGGTTSLSIGRGEPGNGHGRSQVIRNPGSDRTRN